YGYTRQEALGRRTAEFLHSAGVTHSPSEVTTKLLQEGSWSGEFINKTKDGRLVTVESRLQLESFGDCRLVLASSRDITERKTWEKRQNLLLAELSHRVKNSLAIVQAIAHQTMRNSRSAEEFSERFDGRLLALSEAHKLLVESNWEGADLATLARIQLHAFVRDRPERLIISGEAVSLPADVATPFGLVFHELATNAAKYGSLSRPSGTVTLSWMFMQGNEREGLRVIWREKGGPRAQPPGAAGFGSTLIQSAIPNATVRREFCDDGLLCTIDLVLPGARGNGAEAQG